MFFQHEQATIYAVEFGTGSRTLVGLGGWIGNWELWADPFSSLSKTWRCVSFDHRGSGITRAPVDSITFENLVADVVFILDRFEIDQCVLAAESMGVAVALQTALDHPERFSGLVLIDGAYYRPFPTHPDPFVENLKRDFPGTIAWFVDTCVLESEPHSDVIRHWGRQILHRSTQPAAIKLIECMYGLDLKPRLGEITQPTLIIHSEEDAIAPVANSELLAAKIPTSQLHILPGTGHVPTTTRPMAVSEAINQYFSLDRDFTSNSQ